MNAMTAARQAELSQCRMRLPAELTAPGQARQRVRRAIREWGVPVDEDVALLLTSDLVTHVIEAGARGSITLVIACLPARLCIEVHDASRSMLGSADAPAQGAAAGGVLSLVGSLSAEWGSYRTPAGIARFFTLALMPDLAVGAWRAREGHGPQGIPRGDGEA